MMEITTDVKSHVIITHSGGHYFISPQQNDNLGLVGQNDYFELDGNKIKGSSIAEVMTVSAYYDTYPNKRPAPKQVDGFAKYESLINSLTSQGGNQKAALESVMRGIKRYIDEQRPRIPQPAIDLYNQFEKKLKNLESHENPQTTTHS